MVWQLVAIWVIVAATIVWFVRDERRLQAEARLAAAARYYAQAPQYRHVTVSAPVPRPAQRVGGLTASQRQFMQNFAKTH